MDGLPAGHRKKRQRAYHPELPADKLQHGDEIVDLRRFVKAADRLLSEGHRRGN